MKASLVLLCVTGVMAADLSAARAASTASTDAKPTPVPGTTTLAADPSDVALDGWGDERGYHVAVGTGAGGFSLRQVATIAPAGIDAGSWTGYQCLSGDGRYAAVAVLPSSSVNVQQARDRGAFAYSVDLTSGAVIPVASHVALKYFSPGCGASDSAVFTVSLGHDEGSTEVVRVDLVSGHVLRATTVRGQLTSAVPSGPGAIVAVAGDTLVSVGVDGTLAHVVTAPGDPYDLRPTATGGMSFLSTTPDSATATALNVTPQSHLTEVASGPKQRLQLFPGRVGRSVLTGSSSSDAHAAAAAGVKILNDSVLPDGATGASLDGSAMIASASNVELARDPSATIVATPGLTRSVVRSAGTATTTKTVSTYIPPGATTQPEAITRHPMAQPHGDSRYSPSASSVPATGTARPAAAQIPTCAVPRLDPTKQVMQPSPAQVTWASQLAERGLLTTSRPAGWDNLGLAAYAPSSDFPPITLSHPSGSTWTTVPASVYEAIMAQESNFSQASWHAPAGMAGDPLIADYYGAAGDIVSINYAGADCGYGVGQVTDGMHAGDTEFSAHGQIKIAVDYQENIAAGLQILEATWNQLFADGIIANNGDPKDLENWYFAAWAYNSGVQPNGSFDTTGCTPGPSCTGPDGTWGLGWSNNPANPDYPPSRAPYLKLTYADAAHPSSWPYEERIMGWMGNPIIRDNGPAYATPTYQGSNSWLQTAPFNQFCSVAANHCDPTSTNPTTPDAGHCLLNDYECWFHGASTWISSCATTCATSAYQFGSGSSEPANPNPNPPTCSQDTSTVPSGSIIVDDQPSPPTDLAGCGSSNWSSNGSFTYQYGTNASGDPIGAIDTHQLGAGFGGHILFSHTETGSNPSLINTGTWTPNLPSLQYYTVKIHIPALGADATNLVYTVNPGGGVSPWKIRVNQAWNNETWVTIGTFAMQNGGNVVLTNESPNVPGAGSDFADYDVAYDAVAFVPKGGTPGVPIGGPPSVQDEPKGSNPVWVQCGCGSRTAGDPIDTSTGYFGQDFTDLTTPGRGVPLSLTRTYAEGIADPNGPNKTSAVNGPFGWGWTYSYGMTTATDPNTGAVTITQEDGSRVTFASTAGTYTPTEARDDATLSKSGTTYVYTRRGRTILKFDVSTGHLTSEQDLAGAHATTPYATTLTYNANGQLGTVTDPGSRTYTLTWTSGHISKVADSAGRTVTYGYDTSGDLTDVWGVGSTRTPSLLDNDHTVYTYNTTTHLMASMRSPNNFGGPSTAVTSMQYDGSERVITQTDANGHKTTLNYGPSTTPSLTAGQVLVTDPSGNKDLQTYQKGLLTSETKGYGTAVAGTWTYTYDPISLGVNTMVDPLGNTTTYTYDDHGNRTSASDPLGNTTDWQYDAAGDVTKTIDPDGVATVSQYDQAGHISTGTGTTNPGGFTWGDLTATTITTANNVVESQTGNFGPAPTRTTNYYYDDPAHPGDRTRSTDANNHTVTATYDAAGNTTSSTDALSRRTLYQWDTARGWLTTTVAPSGTAKGTTATCTPPATGCTTFAHDLYGNTTLTTDPLGHTTKATFDADGNQTSATDADNNPTKYVYDPADQRTQTTQADNTTLKSTYNPDGTLATTTDAASAVTKYGYDARARQTTRTDADTRVTTFGYDGDDRTTTVKNALKQTTTTAYDADGRVTGITYSAGTSPNVTNVTYDADGLRLTMTDGTGTTTWSYDDFGDVTSITNGSGATVGYGYDAVGSQTSITYPSGGTVVDGYDAANQLTTVKDLSSATTTFGYNPDGLNTTTSYPSGATVTAGFNDADQQTSTTVTAGATALAATTYGRDSAGQASSETPSGAATGGARTYGYDALQKVKSATIAGAVNTYGYDTANNLTRNGVVTAQFDAADQLCWTTTSTVTGTPTCTSPPTGSTAYGYDAVGRRTSVTPATGIASTITYDQADQISKASTPSGTGTYTYDGSGQRATKTVGTTTTTYTYANGRLLSDGTNQYVYGPGGLPIEQVGTARSFFVHDPLGSTRMLLSATGTVSATYSYSVYGAVLAHTGTSTPLQFGDGYTDTETGLIYLRARYYDPSTGQFLTVDPEVGSTGSAYGYAGDNPLNAIDPLGLSWWNPVSWSGKTWAYIGVGVAAVALGVATAGVGDAVLAGVAVTTETTIEATSIVATEEAVTIATTSITVSETVTTGITVDNVVTGAAWAAAAGGAARGGYDSYKACDDGVSRECVQDVLGTIAALVDPALHLAPGADLLYNIGGLANVLTTPEEKDAAEKSGICGREG